VGRDDKLSDSVAKGYEFQSARPRGARHQFGRRCDVAKGKFQSARPRGARHPPRAIPVRSGQCVSIRAPAWGATGPVAFALCRDMFQSARPRGARQHRS